MPQPSRIPRANYSANAGCSDATADRRIARCFAEAVASQFVRHSNEAAGVHALRFDAWRLHATMTNREDMDQYAQFTTDAAWLECVRNTAIAENPNDRLIKSLSSAVEAAEQGSDQRCADALRFAIAVRFIGLRSDARTAVRPVEIEPRQRQVQALQKWRLKRVVEYVDLHLSTKVTLAELAGVAGLSRMHFASQFRAATNLRPHEFVLRRRVQQAEQLLHNTTTPIVEIALTVGFQTQAHFTTTFKRFVGSTPSRWRAINQASDWPDARNHKAVRAATADTRRLASEQSRGWGNRTATCHP
ncbi:helix-turn-helix domain-containing protein [Bradyrhizobium sp.]|uniref:helix-turn-helix domain-containing protein n=1 Tax=Bradyrhizobium sp. TaxID=376 RepID=UPI003C691169